ncbi:hypothetical protein Tco_0633799 [Tanacetum coccineum]
MFGGEHELKGNGSFGRKEATKTVACSESPYTITDVHECRLAENGGAGLATIVLRSLDSGWDKSIEYYIKKEKIMMQRLKSAPLKDGIPLKELLDDLCSIGISTILSNNGTLTWSEKVEFAIGLLLAYSVGRRSWGSRRVECQGLDETAKWIKLYQALSSKKKGSMASSTALESAYLSHSRSMKMDGVRVQDVLKEYNGPRYEINTRLTINHGGKFTSPPMIRYKGDKVIELYTDHFVNKKHVLIQEPLGTTSEPNEPDIGSGSEAEVDVSEDEWLHEALKKLPIKSKKGSDSGSENGSDSSSGSDSEDSDYFVDEENLIDDVDVDMAEFKSYTDPDVEWVGCKEKVVEENEVFDLEEVDHEDFDSGSDSDEDVRRKALRKVERKLYKELLWKCAMATTIQKFDKRMEEMKNHNIEAYEWLRKIPPQHWPGRAKKQISMNNMSQVLNRQLVDGRDKPIITCLEYIMLLKSSSLLKRLLQS